ncbi:MAG TPA: hypothetical protein VH253_09095 [Phycisphaerae bacterium]|nr:hypothetical protein [Phycisphaerae bacterium]
MPTIPPTPLRLDLPPLRLNPMVLLLTLVTLIFGGFGFTMLIAAAIAAFQGHPPAIVFFLFPLPFAIIALCALYSLLNLTLRSYAFTADPSGLTLTSHFLGTSRTQRFDTPALRDLTLLIAPGATDGLARAQFFITSSDGRHTQIFHRYGAQKSGEIYEALRAALFPPNLLPPDFPQPPPGSFTCQIDQHHTHIYCRATPDDFDKTTRTDQQADITFDGQTLTITTLPSGAHHILPRSAIQSISVIRAPASPISHDPPPQQLQILTPTAPITLLPGRTPADLQWLATALTLALGLTAPPTP